MILDASFMLVLTCGIILYGYLIFSNMKLIDLFCLQTQSLDALGLLEINKQELQELQVSDQDFKIFNCLCVPCVSY